MADTIRKTCVFIDNTQVFEVQRERQRMPGKDRHMVDYKFLKEFLSAGQGETDIRFYFSDFIPSGEPEEFDVAQYEKRNQIYSFVHRKLGFIMVRLPLRKRDLTGPISNMSGMNYLVRIACKEMLDYLRSNLNLDDGPLLAEIGLDGSPSNWIDALDKGQFSEERGLDCQIVHDMVLLACQGYYDRFVLVSGSEDYSRTVGRLRSESGITVNVTFFEPHCSSRLKSNASEFTDLCQVDEVFRHVPKRELQLT